MLPHKDLYFISRDSECVAAHLGNISAMQRLLSLLPVCWLTSCVMPLMPVAPQNPSAEVATGLWLRAHAPHVMGRINGQRVPLLLDTGATTSVFEPDVATGCGLQPVGASRLQIQGVLGKTGASRAVMSTLEIGSWRATNVPCLVRGSSSFRPGGVGSAILGMDHLRRQCSFVTLDYRRGRVELGFSRPYQPRGDLHVSRTPLRWVNGLPYIHVSSDGIAWDAVVDTGSSCGIVVDQSTAARLGYAHGGVGLGRGLILSGVGGSVSAGKAGARVIQVPSAALCGENHVGAALYVMPGPKRVGSRFWEGSRLTLDFRSGSLWLER